MKKLTLLLITLLGLSGCGQVTVEQYADNQPSFTPQTFFNGPLKAEGVVLSRGGELKRYFTATIDAKWDKSHGSLNETFYWNDGEIQHRHWQFTLAEDGYWLGTAGDVEGTAKMKFAGNSIHMRYPLRLSIDGSTFTVMMDDWLFQVSDDVIINKTHIKKFGLRLGEVILTIRKS